MQERSHKEGKQTAAFRVYQLMELGSATDRLAPNGAFELAKVIVDFSAATLRCFEWSQSSSMCISFVETVWPLQGAAFPESRRNCVKLL